VTLVQVLANETSLHMACDFCLTNPRTGEVVRSDAFKLVTVTSPWMVALIGVTGVGELEGKPIGKWIENATNGPDDRRSVGGVLDALARKAEEPLSRIVSPVDRRHSFVVGVVIGTQTRVSLVSNFEVFDRGRVERSQTAALTLTVSSIKPKTAQLFATGVSDFVSRADRYELERMLRSGSSEASIQARLAEVNAAVSRQTKRVSEGCYVASLYATGRGSSRPFLTEEQKGDVIPPEIDQLFRRLGIQLRPAIGPNGKPSPIQVVGSTLVATSRSRKYFQEQLKLQPGSAELWNAYGAFLEDRRQFDEAIEAYEHAIELDASNAWAVSNLAKQYWLKRRNLAEADRLYTEAVRVCGPGRSAASFV
jgi:TPR repeat